MIYLNLSWFKLLLPNIFFSLLNMNIIRSFIPSLLLYSLGVIHSHFNCCFFSEVSITANLLRSPEFSWLLSLLFTYLLVNFVLQFNWENCGQEERFFNTRVNIRHNSVALDVFAEDMKWMNHTSPGDAEVTWLSLSASCWICFFDLNPWP